MVISTEGCGLCQQSHSDLPSQGDIIYIANNSSVHMESLPIIFKLGWNHSVSS